MIDNDIEISYCSERLGTLLKKKGFGVLDEQEREISVFNISHDIAIEWLLINFNIHVWADYDNKLKHWCGNYMILGQVSNWFSGFGSPYEAREAVLECVLENLVN